METYLHQLSRRSDVCQSLHSLGCSRKVFSSSLMLVKPTKLDFEKQLWFSVFCLQLCIYKKTMHHTIKPSLQIGGRDHLRMRMVDIHPINNFKNPSENRREEQPPGLISWARDWDALENQPAKQILTLRVSPHSKRGHC